MKKIACAVLLALSLMRVAAADVSWHEGNISKPLAQAKAEKKMLLLDFTGSDWCPPCKALEKEVFESPEFAEYAKKNLVLVRVDFPNKIEQSVDLKRINEGLKNRYAAPFKGYPTVVLLDADGKKLGDTVGYGAGTGPEKYLAKIEAFAKKRAASVPKAP